MVTQIDPNLEKKIRSVYKLLEMAKHYETLPGYRYADVAVLLRSTRREIAELPDTVKSKVELNRIRKKRLSSLLDKLRIQCGEE